jgi:hypothetical protein
VVTNIFSGQDAIDKLVQAGLIKFQDGKYVEAYPMALTNLGGTVTIKLGESPAPNPNEPGYVWQDQGTITGIGYDPAGGGIKDPVILVRTTKGPQTIVTPPLNTVQGTVTGGTITAGGSPGTPGGPGVQGPPPGSVTSGLLNLDPNAGLPGTGTPPPPTVPGGTLTGGGVTAGGGPGTAGGPMSLGPTPGSVTGDAVTAGPSTGLPPTGPPAAPPAPPPAPPPAAPAPPPATPSPTPSPAAPSPSPSPAVDSDAAAAHMTSKIEGTGDHTTLSKLDQLRTQYRGDVENYGQKYADSQLPAWGKAQDIDPKLLKDAAQMDDKTWEAVKDSLSKKP